MKLNITNLLPADHILPVDPTTIDPPMVKEVGGRVDRIAIHLHGAVVPWTSDGGPMAWFSNAQNPGGFTHGSSFLNNGPHPGSAIYDYPNTQSARLVWYHDHAYGITRLNAYSGLASAYLITDDAESMMIKSGMLPDVPGYPLGIPLIIQDKSFFDPASDPTYPVTAAQNGDLWYPHVYQGPPIPEMKLPVQCGATGRWNISGGTPPSVSLVPEAFFDTNLVNGAPYPVLKVSPRRYRFQALNAAQARFYNLQLYVGDQSPDGITLKESADLDNNGNRIKVPTNPAGPKIIQIGKDSGLLPGAGRAQRPAEADRLSGHDRGGRSDERQCQSLQPLDGPWRTRRHHRGLQRIRRAINRSIQRCASPISDGRHSQRLLCRRPKPDMHRSEPPHQPFQDKVRTPESSCASMSTGTVQ